MNIAVVLAGGVGARVGGNMPKQLLPLADGKTILEHSVDAFELAESIDEVCIVMHPDYIAEAIIDYYENDRQEDYTQYLILEKEKYSWSILTKAFTHIKSLISNC